MPLVFCPARRHSRAFHPDDVPHENDIVKIAKKDAIDRAKHFTDDMSKDLSPFVNRVVAANSNITNRTQRTIGKKKILEDVLQRLNELGPEREQEESQPGEKHGKAIFMSPSQASHLTSHSALSRSCKNSSHSRISKHQKQPVDDAFRDIYLNGQLIETYKDLI